MASTPTARDANTEMIEYTGARRPWISHERLLYLGVPLYCLMLVISLSRFLEQPDWRIFGVAWYAMFQIYAPTMGSLAVMLLVVREVALRRVGCLPAIALCGLVLLTSAMALYWSVPLLLSV